MNWDDVIDRLDIAGVNAKEELYMEHYGKVLAVQRPEFHGRNFLCTFGKVRCEGIPVEIFLFPSDTHLQEFLEVVGDDPWYLSTGNAVLHFPQCDPSTVDRIVGALRG